MMDKDNIKKSMNLISDVNFTDEEYNKIYEKFKLFLGNKQVNDISKILDNQSVSDSATLSQILKDLKKSLDMETLEELTQIIINNEDLVNFIQDIFLDKLI